MGKQPARRNRSERGQSLVEFALVFPFLLLILVGIFDIGRAIWQYNTVSNVAREAVRYAVARSHQPLTISDFLDDESNPRSNAAAIAAGRRQAFGLDSSNLQIRAYPDDDWEKRGAWGLVISATSAYTYSPVTGLVPQGWIVLRATSLMITE